MEELDVTLKDIVYARKVLGELLPPTPLLFNPWLSEMYGCEVFLKMENMQPVGSFKIRGATYKIHQLDEGERKKGVVAASLGNHSQGVAWGSRKLGVSAMIVMPTMAPMTKIKNTERLGAEVLLKGDHVLASGQEARRIAAETGRILIHPYQDADVIAGQGTLGLEILEQLPDVDVVIGGVGGGGLMAGVSIAIKDQKKSVQIFGGQAEGVSPMVESFKAGKIVEFPLKSTFADGINVPVATEPMLKLLKPRLDGIFSETDEDIAASILILMEKAKTVAEGAGAVPLSVLKRIQKKMKGKKVVLIVCGGNIDVNVLSRVVDGGLVRTGRRVRLQALISDRPGSLSRLTQVIAEKGASVLQVIHDRNEPAAQIDETSVSLTLETKGWEHSENVIAAIRAEALGVDLVSQRHH